MNPFEFLWCEPLGGEEALTHHPPPTTHHPPACPLLQVLLFWSSVGGLCRPCAINLFTCILFDLLVV